MGTWDINNFGNDGASDFTFDILEGDKSLIMDAIIKIAELDNDEYLEAPDCENALAAIEFIAAFKGNPAADFPEEAQDWVKKNDLLNFKQLDIVDLSKKAIDRILINSELRELWEEGDEFGEWEKVLKNLKTRIN